MRKLIFTHLFLNLYLLAIVQPAWPIVEYLVNYQYIANELCENKDKSSLSCNGKCYLEKQVKKQQNLAEDQKMPQPPKLDLEKYFTLKNKRFAYHLIVEKQIQQNPLFFIKLKQQIFVDSILRPPIV